MRRLILVVGILVFLVGCFSSSSEPDFRLSKPGRTPLLRITYSNAGAIMALSVYDNGILIFDSLSGEVYFAQAKKKSLSDLFTVLRSKEIKASLEEMAEEGYGQRYADFEELVFTLPEWSPVVVPYEKMPRALFPLIRAIDAVFRDGFGPKYSRDSLSDDLDYMGTGSS